ncbi:phosphoglucosamine mutase [Candidatus Xianfuyuplasma coldseepsis]|uniref:Phosphoglucosamine mutase n=1 Tax=Candidatus Xianfuyuplasma coldseepsis TaxID=2782163 RepID=A0A7L7KSY4_9MOLU|nr:phosphoglucosamine mutase [Xianfuyuplasma coldseepsis]QMS85715.1 phosphoglucosamine mutase [Xianfuyuplasma coldseepsis]
MAKYFGTDGIRGRYNIEINNTMAFQLGQSLKSVLGTTKLVIGMDTRESSSELMYSVVSGAQTVGVDVMVAGVVATPLISLYSYQKQVTGVMITASHNPYKDNGIKVFDNGKKLTQEQELAIEAYMDNVSEFEVTTFGETFSGEDVLDTYLDLIESVGFYETDFRIGVDSANGANYLIARGIFQELTKSFYQMGDEPNGTNINDGVGSTHLEALQAFVKKWELDIGFAFDGDGDRVLIVDFDQTIIDGDQIIYLLAVYLNNLGLLKKQTVVLTKMSNLGIIKAFERQGINVVLTDVGDKYVLQAIEDGGYSIGGENSGHIILRDYLHTGDGLLVALFVLKVLQDSEQSLQELLADITMWPQQLVNIRTYNKDILDDHRIQQVVQDVTEELGSDGKVLVRASGTEPLVRVTISCETTEQVDIYMKQIVDVITMVKEEV